MPPEPAAVRLDRPLLLLFLVGLALRLIWLPIAPYAVYPDPAYYDAAARSMAAGRIEVPFIWSWVEAGFVVPDRLELPYPAFRHWGPLASLVGVPFVWLFGSLEFATALPHILAGSLLGPATYLLARRLGSPRPLLIGLFGAVGAAYGPLLSQPDNYALYALLATGALVAADRARGAGPRRWLLAGLLAGLAWLSRTDGLILAGAIGLIALAERGLVAKLTAAIAVCAGFALPALPWMARQLTTFGSPIPSGSSGAIWIRDYNEQFAADGPFSPAHLLADGLWPILLSRAEALGYFLSTATIGLLITILLPGLFAGLWARRRDGRLLPFGVYAFAYAIWSVVFVAPHLQGGNLMHGLLALGPVAWILSIEGTERLFGALERRSLLRAGAARRLTNVIVPLLAAIGLLVPASAMLPVWEAYGKTGAIVAEELRSAGLDARPVISTSPIPLWRAGIERAIALPLSPAETVERVIRASGAGSLVLDPSHQPELIASWGGPTRPDWLGVPVEIGVVNEKGVERTLLLVPILSPPPE